MARYSGSGTAFDGLEPLESRRLLSTVYQFQAFATTAASGWALGAPEAINDDGLVLTGAKESQGGTAFSSAVAVWSPARSGPAAVTVAKTGAGEINIGSLSRDGSFALRGVFDDHGEAVGLFDPGQTKPSALIVGDTVAPYASPASSPYFGAFNGQGTLRWTITFHDGTLIKRSTLGGNDFKLALPDHSERAVSFIKAFGTGDGPEITAIYEAHVPTATDPKEHPVNGMYTLTLQADSVTDTLDHKVVKTQLWSQDITGPIVAWKEPKEPAAPPPGPRILPFDGKLEWSISTASMNAGGQVAINAFTSAGILSNPVLVKADGLSARAKSLTDVKRLSLTKMLDDGRVAVAYASADRSGLRYYSAGLSSWEEVLPDVFEAEEVQAVSDDGHVVVFSGIISTADAAVLGTVAGSPFYVSVDGVIRALGSQADLTATLFSDTDNSRLAWHQIGGVTNVGPGGIFTIAGLGGRWTDGVEIAQVGFDALAGTLSVGSPERLLGRGDSVAELQGPITEVTLGSDSISNTGRVAFYARSDQGSVLVEATALARRPVLFIPGIFGSFPNELGLKTWIRTLGQPPSVLAVDPLAHTYDDLLQTLRNQGYRDGVDLFEAPYDWRLPLGPQSETAGGDPAHGSFDRVIDGHIAGLSGASITDSSFQFGVDYLGDALVRAAAAFQHDHGFPLDKVDIVAHSMGGLVARTYIQSDAYGGFAPLLGGVLPLVNELVMIATPHRGAEKPWNILHDNWSADPVYKLFLAKIAWVAYKQVMGVVDAAGDEDARFAKPIDFASGGQITRDQVLELTNSPKYQPHDGLWLDPAMARHAAFLELYAPTVRTLLATFDFMQSDALGGQLGLPGSLADINTDPYQSNAYVLDLNDGLDLVYQTYWQGKLQGRDSNHFADLTTADMIYGDSDPTYSSAAPRLGSAGGDGFGGDKKTIFTMSSTAMRSPYPEELWYEDQLDVGDQTVPTKSSSEQFRGDPRVGLYRFARLGTNPTTTGPVDHGGLNDNADVETLVVRLLHNAPNPRDITSGLVGAGLSALGKIISLYIDPIAAVVIDADGHRLGWDGAQVVNTFPAGTAIYLGEGDGVGLILGDVNGPLTLEIHGSGTDHRVLLDGSIGGTAMVPAVSEGVLAAGSVRTMTVQLPAPPAPGAPVTFQVAPGSTVSGSFDGAAVTLTGRSRRGTPITFEQAADDSVWTRTDLADAVGAPALTGDVVTWTDPEDGNTYAAGVGSNSLTLFRRTASGWAAESLLGVAAGSPAIASSMTVLIDSIYDVLIAGLAANGDLLLYERTGFAADGRPTFTLSNLFQDILAPAGSPLPKFAGRLISYATAWNGLNIAGLDGDGHIWSVWTSPGLGTWYSSDLSAITSAPPLAGGLTAYLTPWSGINLAGIDVQGNLTVTWWVPSFGGNWVNSNMTDTFGGPALRPESITSYVTSWNGLNIAGTDAATGELVVYWWVPGFAATPDTDRWVISPLTEGMPSTAPRPVGAITSLVTDDGRINLIGQTSAGDVVRVWWKGEFGGDWKAEDLTTI